MRRSIILGIVFVALLAGCQRGGQKAEHKKKVIVKTNENATTQSKLEKQEKEVKQENNLPPVEKKLEKEVVKEPAKPEKHPIKKIEERPLVKFAPGTGTVAIIIDDMGNNVKEVQQLMSIHIPMTFSIIPWTPKDKEVAEEAHDKGYVVMVHMPMQAKGGERLGKEGLYVSLSDENVERSAKDMLDEVPYAVGANNHMGSLFTENTEKMRDVLSVLKDKGFFFIDSKTIADSVGYTLAKQMGVKCASRQVFLDNVVEVGAITKQLELLAKIARKKGSAIAICHPHSVTIEALKKELPALKDSGIKFVSVKKLTS